MENILNVSNIIDFRIPKSLKTSVSLRINKHDGVALLGKNGSGKTSLLRMICNIIKPDHGKIILSTENLSFLPYKNALYPHLKVKNYIKVFDHSFITPLEKMSDEHVGNLSAGQQRTLSIFLSMQKKKDLWVLDEPTVFLDYEQKKHFYLILQNFIELGGGVILSTHDISIDFMRKINL